MLKPWTPAGLAQLHVPVLRATWCNARSQLPAHPAGCLDEVSCRDDLRCRLCQWHHLHEFAHILNSFPDEAQTKMPPPATVGPRARAPGYEAVARSAESQALVLLGDSALRIKHQDSLLPIDDPALHSCSGLSKRKRSVQSSQACLPQQRCLAHLLRLPAQLRTEAASLRWGLGI